MKKTLLTICLTWMCFSLSAQKIIDLSGKWSFSIDRQDNGEKEKWFSHTLNDFINLPGSMPEKQKGDEVPQRPNGQAVSMTVPTIIIHTWKNTVKKVILNFHSF